MSTTTPPAGLSSTEAARRRHEVGPNRLDEPPRRPAWLRFVEQFRSVLVGLLAVGAVVAGLVGDLKDTVVIVVVLLVNATLGFAQEQRAGRSLDALRSMLTPTARVRRDGTEQVVPTDDLVPGDLVVLEAGDRVPADGHFVVAHQVELDESSLTGESLPASKVAGVPPDPATRVALAERETEAFMNTTVTRGRAEMVVTATGMRTEMGHVAGLLQATAPSATPLEKQLAQLGQRLAVVAVAAMALYLVVGLVRGEPFHEVLLSAVALAVAAVPEGLPAVVTVTLAIGVNRLAGHGAIVRRLGSVETLGSTSIICTDKTGTLTMNQMTARVVVVDGVHHDVSGEGLDLHGHITPPPDATVDRARVSELLTAAVLGSDADVREGKLLGDPTEGALVVAAHKAGVDPDQVRARHPRRAEVPFESARRFTVTVQGGDPGAPGRLIMKGAFDAVAPRCAMTTDERARRLADMEALADRGLRVLAFAGRDVPAGPPPTDEGGLLGLAHDLTFLGLVGLLDPPRPTALDAIAQCRLAGIGVLMITGDHPATAASIARHLGIEGRTLTGADLDGVADEELAQVLRGVGVVARVSPEHKLRVVGALQRQGHVVAMTGDGVNDAPALARADVGVAMGITGTEVAKDAATVVLTDDDFATIVRAVERGRTIYANIASFVRFQLATNIGAILLLVGAQVLGQPTPLAAIEVLWINLIMDGPPALALGLDPPGPQVMEAPPRAPGDAILSGRTLARLVTDGVVMAGGTLGLLAVARHHLDERAALTLAFTTFVLFQFFNALNARLERGTVLSRATLRNRTLWWTLGAVVVLQIGVVHLGPLQRLFGTASLSIGWWLVALATASTVLVVDEIGRALFARRAPRAVAPVR